MIRRILLLFFALSIASAALAQKTTERYIPIGQSPGVSHKTSYLGEITQVNESEHWMSIANTRGTYRVRMAQDTQVYLDRSSQKKTNLNGGYADCKPGQRVEVKFRDNDPEKAAEWIKVEVTQ